jgi:endonuclease/exonuclease/phosphatase family metal-dependent hydrolase
MIPRAFFWALAALLSPVLALADTGSFCVQTFNVYGPAYASGVNYRLSRLAEEIVKDPCAATQFQEFWRQSQYETFKQELEPARLALVRADEVRGDEAMTGLASAFQGSVLEARAQLFRVNNQNGVLDWVRDLSGVQKGFTALEVKLDNGPLALFVNLHTHPTDEVVRVAQIAQLAYFLLTDEEAKNLPLILTGDLNATPAGPEIAILENVLLLRDSYLEANGAYGETCTYCSENPLSWSWENRVIDFVLVRNSPTLALSARASEVNLRGEKYDPLSDHFGVRSVLSWGDREASLLRPEDPAYEARVGQAQLTIARVEKILGQRDEPYFQELAGKYRAMKEKLIAGELPAELSHFLVP